jgi:hypothetical protein
VTPTSIRPQRQLYNFPIPLRASKYDGFIDFLYLPGLKLFIHFLMGTSIACNDHYAASFAIEAMNHP